jgi:hypothetical protein
MNRFELFRNVHTGPHADAKSCMRAGCLLTAAPAKSQRVEIEVVVKIAPVRAVRSIDGPRAFSACSTLEAPPLRQAAPRHADPGSLTLPG